MMRFSAPAAAVLCCAAIPLAHAETDITTAITTTVSTATAANGHPDDVVITSTGTVTGSPVVLNSNNLVNNQGALTINDVNSAAAILVQGGFTGSVTNTGSISVGDSAPSATIPLTPGENRYGIQVVGSSPFNGSITEAGTLGVRGNDSAGILVGPGINGSVTVSGTLAIIGNNSYGVQTLGPVTGNVTLSGAISAQGTGSVGASIGQVIGGQIYIGNSLSSTGYLNATRPTTVGSGTAINSLGQQVPLPGLANVGPNDVLQGGPALFVQGSVTGGVFVDGDGLVESNGSAPAIVIGPPSGGSAELGYVMGAPNAYGLLVLGSVIANGVYDTYSATGIQIGGTGGSVTVDGGVRIGGSVTVTSYAANATGILLSSGANAPILTNTGAISATIFGGAGNFGPVAGTATGVLDSAGTLSLIQNTGTITTALKPGIMDVGVTGSAIALDLRANTKGVTVSQFAGSTTTTPSITGDILFGSGNAQLNLLGGSLTGAAAFGSGVDSLTLDNGATMVGALTNSGSGGNLTVNVANGHLQMTNVGTTTLSSLQVGAKSEVDFGIDPASGQAGKFNVLGATIISTGAKIGADFESKLTGPASFTLIQSGSLSTGASGQTPLLGAIPFLYNANLVANPAAGTLTMNLSPRTAAQAGVPGGQAAFSAIFSAFDRDPQIRQALLGATSQQSFSQLYEQMLPDYAGGLFQALSEGFGALAQAESASPVALRGDRSGVWAQQFGFGAERDRNTAPSYRAGGVGLAFGKESAESEGTLGWTAAYMRANVDDRDAGAYNHVVATAAVGGAYWRTAVDNIKVDVGVNGGYSQFTSGRVLNGVDGSGAAFTRNADAHWNGGIAQAHAGVAYEEAMGDYFIRPEADVDYFFLYQGSHAERNGGSAFDLSVASSTSKQGSAKVAMTVGTHFGQEFVWKPQVTVGWRETFGVGPADTVAQFVSGGPAFALAPQALDNSGYIARAALHGSNQFSDVAIEAGGESRGDYHGFDGQLVTRLRF